MKFKKGETVIYPQHGACTVVKTEKIEAFGQVQDYLVLKTVINEMTLRVPVAKAAEVGDRLVQEGRLVIGPSREAAQLESSKAFAKAFMARHSVPSARFEICDTLAGALALRSFGGQYKHWTKGEGDSPVTEADHAVDAFLKTALLGAVPDAGWLSEETPDTAARLDKTRVWVIDPIDGTKAFIRREPEYCVSVALVEHGNPIVAAIYNPSTDELYTAVRGSGLRLNDRPVAQDGRTAPHPLTVALSPWELHIGRFKSVEAHLAGRPMRSIAWALALAAKGEIMLADKKSSEDELVY